MTTAHSSLTNAELHEPKYIKAATSGDAGKVITPSSTNYVGELRLLAETEITSITERYQFSVADISSSGNTDLSVVTTAGDITAVWVGVTNGTAPDANTDIEVSVNGVVQSSCDTQVASAAAQYADYSTTGITGVSVAAGDVLTVNSDGASTTATSVSVVVVVTRTSP